MARRIEAVIFDMDGLLVDSEVYWEESRQEFCETHDCAWTQQNENGVKGMNSPEWAASIAEHCRLGMPHTEIIEGVIRLMRVRYDRHLPLLPGAVEVVCSVAEQRPLAIASSSPPQLIEWVIKEAGIRERFRTLVSADTVGKGKPAPDVFLVAAQTLGVPPERVAVFEDSTAGIRAGLAAGMRVIAVPNSHYPPDPEVLAQAHSVLSSLEHFDPTLLA